MMDEAVHIELHLKSRVPVLEGKHGSPIAPEIGVEKFIGEDILNRFIL